MQETQAVFFDGMTAGRIPVTVSLGPDRLALFITGDSLPEPLRWPLGELRGLHSDGAKHQVILTLRQDGDDELARHTARLVLEDTVAKEWLLKTRPDLFRKDVPKGTFTKIAKFTGMAVGATVLMLFVILPAMANTLAAIIPIEREIAFGKTVVSQIARVFGGTSINEITCTNTDGLVALDTMVERLTENQDMTYDISVRVFDHPMINAFAAPGGQVVVMKGLIDNADDPDEVAAVLAHEIGHVESRDATRHALRSSGSAGLLTMLIGDFTGGAAMAILGEQLLSASYTREAEGLADEFALDMLQDANVSADGMARFFEVLDETYGESVLPAYLSTHPVSAERAARARSFSDGQGATKPVLNDKEWQDLKEVCD